MMLWENPFSFPGFLIQISKCLPGAVTLLFMYIVKCANGVRVWIVDVRQSVSRLVRRFTQPPYI